jgi:hypothetical protein
MDVTSFKIQQKASLLLHERFMAGLIISGILFLITLNIVFDEPIMPLTESEHCLVNSLIEVIVEGAIEFPGSYQVKKGTFLKEIIELAKPFPNANLERVKLDSPITRRRVIKIPKKINPKPESKLDEAKFEKVFLNSKKRKKLL